MIPHNLLGNWSAEQVAQLHDAIFVASHRLTELEQFSDAGLVQTLDAHPRDQLGVFTMGSDPVRRNQWQAGDAGRLSGKTLLETVRRGRLLLNLRHIAQHHEVYRVAVDTLYNELESLCIDQSLIEPSADLWISSPAAMTYYEVDRLLTMLWQVRGTKQVWAYPLAAGILSNRTLESVLYSGSADGLEYYPELDRYAREVDLAPGQMMTWPHHTPYRSVNRGGLNVTLVTHHATRGAIRRNRICLANRSLRRVLGRHFPSTRLDGIGAAVKDLAIRAADRLPGAAPKPPQRVACPITFCVDPTAPNAIRALGTPPAAARPIVAPAMDVTSVDMPVRS